MEILQQLEARRETIYQEKMSKFEALGD